MQQLHIMSIAFPVNVTEAMLGKHTGPSCVTPGTQA